MCSEVKTIKEKYSYNFEKFLKINNEACPQRIDIIKELETLAENLVSNILKNDNSIERIKNNEVAIPIIGICKHFGFKIYDMDFEFLSEKNKEYKNASGMIAISQKFKHEYDSLPNDIIYYELITKLSEIFMAPTTAVDIRVKELKELGVI